MRKCTQCGDVMGNMDDKLLNDLKRRASEADDLQLDEELQEIACAVKQLPDLEVPADLLTSVMGAIQQRRLPWYRRFYNWTKVPRSFTFTPLQIAASAALLIFCTTFIVAQFLGREQQHLAQSHDQRIPVVFTLNLPDAQSVAVVGSFNQWHPQGFEMHDADHHHWTLTMELPEGRYEYAFLVDGKKMVPDPHAHLYQNDGFGNRNAVLILGTKNDQAI